MKIRLDYSGHYSPKIVEVTDEQYAEIQRLTQKAYLFDSEEGNALIDVLETLPAIKEKIPTVVIYC